MAKRNNRKNLKISPGLHRRIKKHVKTLGSKLEAWTEGVLDRALPHGSDV